MTDLPLHTQTLNEFMTRKAAELSHKELELIIQGFREQAERWNIEQAAGSRKFVKSKHIPVESKPLVKSKIGLKL